MCERFGDGVETIEHCIRDCEWSAFYWKLCKLRIDGPWAKELSIQDWILEMIKGKREAWIELFAYYLWGNWKQRNQMIYEKKMMDQMQSCQLAEDMWEGFRSLNEKGRSDEKS